MGAQENADAYPIYVEQLGVLMVEEARATAEACIDNDQKMELLMLEYACKKPRYPELKDSIKTIALIYKKRWEAVADAVAQTRADECACLHTLAHWCSAAPPKSKALLIYLERWTELHAQKIETV